MEGEGAATEGVQIVRKQWRDREMENRETETKHMERNEARDRQTHTETEGRGTEGSSCRSSREGPDIHLARPPTPGPNPRLTWNL